MLKLYNITMLFGCFLIPQYFSEDFPDSGLGQVIPKFDRLGHFVDGQFCLAEINDFFG